jgi:hypothetical protein
VAKWIVRVPEVWYQGHCVEAETAEEAERIVRDGDDNGEIPYMRDYGFTLDTWPDPEIDNRK